MVDIYINEQPLNFTLQGEKVFSQIRHEVIKWLAGEYFIVEGCKINNEQIELENLDNWDDKDIGTIESVRFEVRPLVEINFERLQTVHQYLILLKKGIEKENTNLFLELTNEYPIIENQLNMLLNPNGENAKNSDVIVFSNLLENSGFFKGKIEHKDTLQNAAVMCESFISILHERMKEFTNPMDELRSTIDLLRSLIEPMNEIPVLLQTGKDGDAMQTILGFIEASQKMIRLYPILKATSAFDMQKTLASGETLEQFYSDFNRILHELQEAFNASDSILIGDLLEYEISPRIENLTTLITE